MLTTGTSVAAAAWGTGAVMRLVVGRAGLKDPENEVEATMPQRIAPARSEG